MRIVSKDSKPLVVDGKSYITVQFERGDMFRYEGTEVALYFVGNGYFFFCDTNGDPHTKVAHKDMQSFLEKAEILPDKTDFI